MAQISFSDALLNPDLVASFDPLSDSLHLPVTAAAFVHVTKSASSLTLTTSQGSLTLPMTIDQMASGINIITAEGSMMVVGDNSTATVSDNLANSNFANAPTDDQFHGLDGDDHFLAGAGDDLVYGNKGADSMVGGNGNDSLYGGQGDDRINDSGGDNLVYGNLGNDTVSTGGGQDTIYGGQGADIIDAGAGNDLIFGNRGGDILAGGLGADQFIYRRPVEGMDLIQDFTKGEDKIVLAHRVLQIDAVTNENFVSNASGFLSANGQTRFIYDRANDILYYDPDGTGSAAAEALLKFQSGSLMATTDNLGVNDFLVTGLDKTLVGSEKADTLSGDSGADLIRGLGGPDLLQGHVGADTLHGGAGADTLDGGQGNDMALYNNHDSAITVNLLQGVAVDGKGVTDTLIGIEQVVGTAFDDVLKGDPRILYTLFNGKVPYGGGLKLFGMDGNDSLVGANGWCLDGGNGMDTLVAAGGNNFLSGGAGNDSLVAASGNDTLAGGANNDYAFGGEGNDLISGNMGIDWLAGGGGDDLIYGDGAGTTLDHANDTLQGGLGNDTLDGGDGLFDEWAGDVASYQDATAGLEMLVSDGAITTSRGETDILIGIEGVRASDFADTITGGGGFWIDGADGDDQLVGSDGDDSLTGGSGNDHIQGLAGNDLIYGGDGDDFIDADGGLDTVFGGAGDDEIHTGALQEFSSASGGAGNDYLLGGSGSDFFHGDTGNDTLDSGAGNDTLFADSGLDILVGGDGNDALSGQEHPNTPTQGATERLAVNSNQMSGGAGDDLLIAGYTSNGSGVDSMTGGTGADDFLFQLGQDLVDTTLFNNLGLIMDFERGIDRVLIEVDTGLTMETQLVDGVNFIAIADPFSGNNAGDNPTYVFSEAEATLYYAPGAPGSTDPLALLTLNDGGVLAATDIWLTP